MASTAIGVGGHKQHLRTERRDAWWLQPLIVVVGLGSFGVYAFWAALQNAHYYAAPYLSPFYSPCIAANCEHPGLPLIGSWWNLSPAFLVLWIPLGFRVTCYYYRKSYYRAFFWDPPACAIREVRRGRYRGERSFPFVLSGLHRYALILTVLVTIVLWIDVIRAFDFGGRFGIGLGTLVMLTNVILLTLYTGTCHSLRYLAGGNLDCYSCARAGKLRHRLSSLLNRLNPQHGAWAWYSMFSVGLTDLYIRLLQAGVLHDLRWITG
jgi:hypothetical protein